MNYLRITSILSIPKNLYQWKNLFLEYKKIINKYNIKSIEDPFSENDWNSWNKIMKLTVNKVQIVGDDLYVTNIERLKKGFLNNSSNAILIKLKSNWHCFRNIGSYQICSNNWISRQ